VIIDMHNHVWPDEIAARALGTGIPEMPLRGDGTVAGLAEAQDAAGIDRSVCLAIANTPDRVERANAYIGSLDRRRFIPFGTIHPRLAVEENLRHLRAAGVAGVKLHPTFQGYRLDDPDLITVLGALAGEFPVIAHVGAGAGADGSGATPAMVRDIVRRVPELTLIACHFGGYHHLAEAMDTLIGEPLYFDTSWPPSLATVDADAVREIIRRHGADRVVYASDWPTASPQDEIETLRGLGLTSTELDLILGGNAARLLRLDPA
jgi:predicted TIM-barrel fold metal-dependent hydrolase